LAEAGLGATAIAVILSGTDAELRSSVKAILQLDWNEPAKVKEQYYINGRYTAFI
jgi:hypothetical protein